MDLFDQAVFGFRAVEPGKGAHGPEASRGMSIDRAFNDRPLGQNLGSLSVRKKVAVRLLENRAVFGVIIGPQQRGLVVPGFRRRRKKYRPWGCGAPARDLRRRPPSR